MGQFRKQVDQITPAVYASFAIILYQRGWKFEEINQLFKESQDLWIKTAGEKKDMIKECEKLTGIILTN